MANVANSAVVAQSQQESVGKRTISTLMLAYAGRMLIHMILATAALIVAAPFLWMASTALKPMSEIFVVPPQWIPRHPQWQNFSVAWHSATFGRFYTNSLIVALTITCVQLANVTMAAYVFARIAFRGRDIIFLLFLATMMIPTQVTIVPVFILLKQFNWINTYMALIVPFFGSAFGTFLMRQAFLSIPQDLVDAAKLDGAGHIRTLWSVMLPLSVPMLVTFTLLTFMWHWNDYFFPLIVTSTNDMRTLPIGLTMFMQSEGGSAWNLLIAAALFVMAPVMILFLLAQRQFIQGVASTGMKG